jgi:hypothetical protein
MSEVPGAEAEGLHPNTGQGRGEFLKAMVMDEMRSLLETWIVEKNC